MEGGRRVEGVGGLDLIEDGRAAGLMTFVDLDYDFYFGHVTEEDSEFSGNGWVVGHFRSRFFKDLSGWHYET